MKSVHDYFKTDVRHQGLAVDGTRSVNLKLPDGQVIRGRIECTAYYDGNSGTQFYSVFVPAGPFTAHIALWVVRNVETAIHVTKIGMTLMDHGREPVNSRELKFSGSLLLYTEDEVSEEDIEVLREEGKKRGVKIQYCGPKAAMIRYQADRPAAFISHDSRDRREYAGIVARELSKKGIKVWYDEFSLKVGDSLRESIEKGLKECRACVLLLSRNYLTNRGWTKTEFNSVFTRELIEQANLLLPVWIDVEKKDVFEYCPDLANRVAARWAEGRKNVVKQLLGVLGQSR